jgi:hypothetical protein
LLCVTHGATAGRHWEQSAARATHRSAILAGVRRRFALHQLRHAHAVELAHDGVPLVVIPRQLGHAHLGITSIYLQRIDSVEIIDTAHSRPAPLISATAGLRASNSRASSSPAHANRGSPARGGPQPSCPRIAGLPE